jgi:hypothetical protein
MFNLRKLFIVLLSFSLLNSCITHRKVTSAFTPLTSADFINHSQKVDLYFEGTPVQRDYIQIGYVEAVGEELTTNDSLIAHLRSRASQSGAHAIINIKKTDKTKSRDGFISDKYKEQYSLPMFSGVAIKYTDELLTDSAVLETNDTSLVIPVENEKISEEQKKVIITSVLGLLGMVLAVIVLDEIVQRPPDMSRF